jgi:hypothetical protein
MESLHALVLIKGTSVELIVGNMLAFFFPWWGTLLLSVIFEKQVQH